MSLMSDTDRQAFTAMVENAGQVEITWLQQSYDPNGHPTSTLRAKPVLQEPKTVLGLVVVQAREFLQDEGYVRVLATEFYLPAHTGVRAGDVLIPPGYTQNQMPPVLTVEQQPDDAEAIYEHVVSGFRSRGAP